MNNSSGGVVSNSGCSLCGGGSVAVESLVRLLITAEPVAAAAAAEANAGAAM